MAKRCMGCMEEYDDEFEVCPYCGYIEGTKAEIPYHIQPGEILVYRYIIGKVLGFGSFGVTYLGWDCLLEKKIAIKEYLPNEFATRAEGTSEVTVFDGEKSQQFTIGKDKFSDEAKKLATFNKNKGIITVYDQFEDNGTSYIVMDYYEGETLQQRLDREGQINYEEAIEIMMPLLTSLQEVHDSGIIHRDISPDNIYITKDGEIKLLDFGAARYASTNMSKSLSAIYKQGFAPYEQYQSSREQGPWSDVYALGATFYYMITGIVPQEAMNRLTKEDDKVEAPRKINKDIPKNLSNAIMNAMIVYPQQRTQSVTEFKKEIEDVQTEIKKTKYPKKFLIPIWAKVATGATTVTLVTLCLLIAFGVIDLSSILGNGTSKTLKDNQTYIPGVLNMSLTDAQEEADDSEVVLQIIDKVQNEKVSANKIMTQDPKPGLIMIKNGLVNVVISKGETQAIVPDVTYMKEEMAKQLLENAGFKVKIKKSNFKGVASGTVGKQSVKGNSVYDAGSTITITVCEKGKVKGKGKVGNYVNKKLSSSITSANKQGLYIVIIERKYDNNVKSGYIISQSVEKGTKLKSGSIVEVTVSLGKEKVLVPDVQYNDFAAAKLLLEGLGFKVEKSEEESQVVQEGKIISQSVKANTKIQKGKSITLTVSKGSKTLTNAQKKTDKFNNTTSLSTTKDGKVESITVSDTVKVPEKKWSNWTTDATHANDIAHYEVRSKKQYRSRSVTTENTTSTNSTLPGWTCIGRYASGGNWSTAFNGWYDGSAPASTASRQYKERYIFQYFAYICPYCGTHDPFNSYNGDHRCSGCKRDSSSYQKTYVWHEYSIAHYGKIKGDTISGKTLVYKANFGGGTWYCNASGQVNKKQYGWYNWIPTYSYKFSRTIYGEWSPWQDTAINRTGTVDVQTSVVYQYRKK